MGLGRPPNYGRLRSWGLWHIAYPGVRALTVRGDAQGLLRLLDGPGDPPNEDRFSERAMAAFALGTTQATVAIDRLAELLSLDEQLSVRVCAADALNRIGGPVAAKALIPALDYENWAVLHAALKTFEATPLPEAWPSIAALADGKAHSMVRMTGKARSMTRMNAAGALGQAKDDKWIPVLESAIRDKSLLVTLGAAVGLRDTESPAALVALTKAGRDVHGVLRKLLLVRARYRLRRSLRRGTQPVT